MRPEHCAVFTGQQSASCSLDLGTLMRRRDLT